MGSQAMINTFSSLVQLEAYKFVTHCDRQTCDPNMTRCYDFPDDVLAIIDRFVDYNRCLFFLFWKVLMRLPIDESASELTVTGHIANGVIN